MRNLFLALVASATLAVAACAPGGPDGTTGPTLDPNATQPGMTMSPGLPTMTDGATAEPTDGATAEPTDGATAEPDPSY